MKQIFLLASALLLGSASVAAAGDGATDGQKTPRLKYRSGGPVCSCSSGMSEAEISKGLKSLSGTIGNAGDGKLDEIRKDPGFNQKEGVNEVR